MVNSMIDVEQEIQITSNIQKTPSPIESVKLSRISNKHLSP